MILTRNNTIAVEPIKEVAAAREFRGGMSIISQKVSLVPAKVVFDGHGDLADIKPGMTIYVNGDAISRSDWAKKVYTAGGKDFVLVPKEVIVLVDNLEQVERAGSSYHQWIATPGELCFRCAKCGKKMGIAEPSEVANSYCPGA